MGFHGHGGNPKWFLVGKIPWTLMIFIVHFHTFSWDSHGMILIRLQRSGYSSGPESSFTIINHQKPSLTIIDHRYSVWSTILWLTYHQPSMWILTIDSIDMIWNMAWIWLINFDSITIHIISTIDTIQRYSSTILSTMTTIINHHEPWDIFHRCS